MPDCTDMQLERIQQNKLIIETPCFTRKLNLGAVTDLSSLILFLGFFVVRVITQRLCCLS
jgi:hypothetical protein